MNKRKSGTEGESLAVDYLRKKGYRILERNFRYGRGEIDIVAEERDTLVFIEVKARRSASFGEPEEAVSPRKCRRIRTTAEGYLFRHNIDDRPCRFDLIGIRYQGGSTDIRHLEDAF